MFLKCQGYMLDLLKFEQFQTKRFFERFFTNMSQIDTVRSTRPEVICEKGVLRNLAKFTGKYLYQRLFFNKVAGLLQNNSGGCFSTVS